MRILLIGNTTLQNDAVKKILLSQDGWEVSQIYPSKITEEEVQFGKHHFFLSIIDLGSLDRNFESFIRGIRDAKLATYLVVIYDKHSDSLLQKLAKAGADTCVSINSETQKFVNVISQFRHS